jgi:MFS family permease
MNILNLKVNKVIFCIAIAAIFYGISIGINVSTFSLILDGAGFSKSKIGEILSSEMISTFFIAPFIPMMIRRLGIFKVISIALVVRNLFLVLFGYSTTQLMWSSSIFIFGAGGLLLVISFQIWINKITDQKNRATYFGILNASVAFGIAIGPILTGFLGMQANLACLILSSLSCLMIFPILYGIREFAPKIQQEISLPFSQIVDKARIPIISGLLVDYIFFSLSTYIILYSVSNGASLGDSRILISYMVISKIFFDIPIGMIIDKFDRNFVMLFCACGVLISAQLLPYVIGSKMIILLFAFWGSFVSGIYISAISNLGDNFRGNNLVTANSALFIMNSLGAYTGIYATGYAIDYFGDYGLIISISAVTSMFILLNIFSIITTVKKY